MLRTLLLLLLLLLVAKRERSRGVQGGKSVRKEARDGDDENEARQNQIRTWGRARSLSLCVCLCGCGAACEGVAVTCIMYVCMYEPTHTHTATRMCMHFLLAPSVRAGVSTGSCDCTAAADCERVSATAAEAAALRECIPMQLEKPLHILCFFKWQRFFLQHLSFSSPHSRNAVASAAATAAANQF